MARPTYTIDIIVPLASAAEGPGASGGQAGAGGFLPQERAGAYLDALKREVVSAAGELPDASVDQINWVGGSAVNMTLAFWCGLVEILQGQFPGVNTARMRFDVGPGLVSSKTVAYAFRFNTCFNVIMESLDDSALGLLGQAREHMRGERFSTFGVQASPAAFSDQEQARETIAQLKALETGYVRLTGGEGGVGEEAPAWLADMLEEAGYHQLDPAFFATSAKYRRWFADAAGSDRMGFGLGAESRYAGAHFVATSDADEYIAKAGLSMDIYRVIP